MVFLELNCRVKIGLDRKWLEKVAENFFALNRMKGKSYFSLAFVAGPEIKKWNRLYRGKDEITDVLSFVEEDQFVDPSVKDRYLGEIIICVPRAKQQAKELKHSLKQEITRLLVHGLAHLAGYDHENVPEKEVKRMEKLEDKVMVDLGY